MFHKCDDFSALAQRRWPFSGDDRVMADGHRRKSPRDFSRGLCL
jgi:hypothetical protein